MKIGIDGNPLTIPFPCGSKNYARQLIFNLAKIDKKNTYYVFSKTKVILPRQKNFRLIKIPRLFPILKRQLLFPYLARKQNLDIFHFLEPYGILFQIHPNTITTVHDYNLNYTYPFNKFPLERINTEIFRFFTIHNSKFFITATNTIKKELLPYISKGKVICISEGVDDGFKVTKSPKPQPPGFILAMGDFAPRKNIPRVLKAYGLLPLKLKRIYELIIVASTALARKNFEKSVCDLNIQKHVRVLENVSTQKLADLYNQAACFLYPSLYEGFGIPILEAMACGCPVITSNYGAVKEVAGNCAMLVNPKSSKQIFMAIEKVLTNKRLSASLRLKGLKRAKQFSWQETARLTLKVYDKAFEESRIII